MSQIRIVRCRPAKVFHEGPDCRNQDTEFSWSAECIFEGGKLFDPQGSSEGAGNSQAYQFDDSYEPHLQDGTIVTYHSAMHT